MFEKILQKIDYFNELKGCKGTYTLVNKDNEAIISSQTSAVLLPEYVDNETYYIEVKKPDLEYGFTYTVRQGFISTADDEDLTNQRIQVLSEFMDSVEGITLFTNMQ